MGLPGNNSVLFPISKYVASLNCIKSTSALKAATFATYQFADLEENHPTVSALTLAYRAVVEVVLCKHFTNVDYRIKKVNAQYYNSFVSYLDQIEEKFSFRDENRRWVKANTKLEGLRGEFLEAYNSLKGSFYKLTIWTALEMVTSPCMESLILIDRLLYLEEHENVEASLVPLFDAKISPRNVAVVAKKL
jgi:hypothetical protein